MMREDDRGGWACANHVCLSPFGYWDIQQRRDHRDEIGIIRELMLGRVMTDFGSRDFSYTVAVLFTL